ncbi:MAG: PAS domain S-box protein [Bacteroidales bacterium]|nr:PAS domain S-box protein [Bacteroidales bacterium]
MKLNTKMLISILSTSVIIFVLTIGYISIKSKNNALNNAINIADSYAKEYANMTKANINVDMDIARAMAQAFKGYKNISPDIRMNIYNDILINIAKENNNFLSVWTNWELIAIDSTWDKPFGRARFTVYRDRNNNIIFYSDTLNRSGDVVTGAYYGMKISKLETIMDPYFFSYTKRKEDEILETSVCVPMIDSNEFIGIAGIDLSLDRFVEIIDNIKPIKNSFAYLIANNGAIIAHPNHEFIGKLFSDVLAEEENKFKVTKNINEGKSFSYFRKDILTGHEFYVSYAPIIIGKSVTPWSLGIVLPVNVIMAQAEKSFYIAIIVGLFGLVILTLVIWIIARNISLPLINITNILKLLAKGHIDESTKIHISSKDEIGEIAESVNTLVNGLNSTAQFAKQIGENNLDAEFSLLSDDDILGNSLLEMRKSLKHAEEEENKRKIEDKKQNWITQGIAKFGEILRQTNDNLETLSFNIMSNLIDYIDANQGALYVKNEDDDNNIFYELKSAIAYGRSKILDKKFKPGQGLVGRCAHEKLSIYLLDIPEDYISIKSGLGKSNPKCILLIPIKLNEEIFGVIELASFNKFEEYHIKFVEKLGESIASTISSVKINEKTAKLLEQAQQQSEELSAQEEEMRQNLEELQATQEESTRRETEMNGMVDALNTTVLIMEIDMEGNITTVNDKYLEIYGLPRDKMLGKKHSDFVISAKFDSNMYYKLWDDLKFGKTMKETMYIESHGVEYWLLSTYTPIFDTKGKALKILNISINITESKQQEEEVKLLLEEANNRAQEFSEDQKIMTENLEDIKDAHEKIEEELRKEIEKLKSQKG